MFWWEYLDENEHDMGRSESFQSRAAAEAWLAQGYESLLERGVVEVKLFGDEGETVASLYRMSLEPESG